MLREFTIVTLLIGSAAPAFAQTPGGRTVTSSITGTAAITAIDQKTRSITLRSENGDEDTLTVGPAVTRFDQLKVGDTIKATYSESWVVQVRKPGATGHAAAVSLTANRLPQVPGGEIGATLTATVTVKAVDVNSGSITVAAADGRTRTRRLADKKNLEGIKAGDTLDITYTQSLLMSAEAAKKPSPQ